MQQVHAGKAQEMILLKFIYIEFLLMFGRTINLIFKDRTEQ